MVLSEPVPHLIELPKIEDPRGNLTFVQDCDQIPFAIKRVYWTYDVPAGVVRGSHSHRETQMLIVAAAGSFDMQLFDGRDTHTFHLNRPFIGLYIPPGYWHTLDNFSSGSVCLVMTSTPYDEADYIRDFDDYMAYVKATGGPAPIADASTAVPAAAVAP